MNIPGKAAVDAWNMLRNGIVEDPDESWNRALKRHTSSFKTQTKGCPRSAFKGLWQYFFTEASTEIDYGPNAKYAIRALEKLRQDPSWGSFSRLEQWKDIRQPNESVNHNGQIDVVIALWDNGLIR